MSQEIDEQDKPKFVSGPYDEGIDLNNLPGPPWTPAALGPLFFKLGIVMGAGDLSSARNPSLDPRGFGKGRAIRHIALLGLRSPIWQDEEAERARAAEVARIMQEGEAIQAELDKLIGPTKGTPRQPGAPPLRPGETRRVERGPKPTRHF